MMNPDYTEVLFEEIPNETGHVGIITLNRPQVLNSLNQSMIQAMYTQLQTWAKQETLKAVIIKATGRAFCAGGDLHLTYERRKHNDPRLTQFFQEEYQLNRFIYHFPKPYIAILDGITMGGGVGISIHGSHRLATDHLLFAMPETGIGFFPDVGGTYFLPRMNNKIGFYLGLTGAKLTSDDCIATGVATEKIVSDAIPDIINTLVQTPFTTDAKQSVTDILKRFTVPVNRFSLNKHQDEIERAFSAETIEDILEILYQSTSEFCRDTALIMEKKSPTSLKVSFKAIQQGSKLNFDECMQQEYLLACHFLQSHDFFEGIRAIIIDKDHAPLWQPANLETVSDYEVKQYFNPI